jgi:hypothetical protein
MKKHQAAIRISLAVVAALTAGPALSGCSGVAAENAVNGAVQGATGGGVSLGGKLPAGWPAEVKVIGGELLFGAVKTTNGKPGWVVTIKSASADPLGEAKRALEDAGFVVDPAAPAASVGTTGAVTMKNATYVVVVAGNPDGLLYTVTPAA